METSEYIEVLREMAEENEDLHLEASDNGKVFTISLNDKRLAYIRPTDIVFLEATSMIMTYDLPLYFIPNKYHPNRSIIRKGMEVWKFEEIINDMIWYKKGGGKYEMEY